jgi:hypothetical protein
MSIYNSDQKDFIQTWLYIKKHNVTGLKYFGRTTQLDPIKYPGSGTVWRRHIKKYGNNVTTIWYHLYTDIESIKSDAISFSISHDIINSKEWANLVIEDGINGSVRGRKGKSHSEETRKKISDAFKKEQNLLLDNPILKKLKKKFAMRLKKKDLDQNQLKRNALIQIKERW